MRMLPLDDPRWHDLSSPGGPKAELLAALRALREAPERAGVAIGTVFEHSCHQLSVYGTTRAVIPHMISAAANLPPSHHNRYELLTYAGLFTLLLGYPVRSD